MIKSKKIGIFSVVLVVMLFFSIIPLAFADSDNSQGHGNGKKRFIAHNADEVNAALDQGCTILKENKVISVLICSQLVGDALGFQEDIPVYALDTGANTQINANQVQSKGNTGAGRTIVVLDSGYNYDHPELKSSYAGGYDFVNVDNDPMDDNGHGSHVAGIITGDGIDPKARGVAPDAKIVSGKVLGADGSGYFSDIITGIYWAVDNYHPDAISISIGSSAPYLYKDYCDSVLPDLTNAVKYAVDHNTMVVVAAGNSGNSGISLPGCISYSTTVGAVDNRDAIASFSGRGNALDVVAPGVNIYSAWLGNTYSSASGTSMATPMISGVVALLKAKNPSASQSQIQSGLFKTAKDLGKKRGKDIDYGMGRVDAFAAVNYI